MGILGELEEFGVYDEIKKFCVPEAEKLSLPELVTFVEEESYWERDYLYILSKHNKQFVTEYYEEIAELIEMYDVRLDRLLSMDELAILTYNLLADKAYIEILLDRCEVEKEKAEGEDEELAYIESIIKEYGWVRQ